MTATDHIEAATGERQRRDDLFETGQARREVIAPGAGRRYGDPDDPGRPSVPFSADTAAVAWLVKEQMGIPKRDAARERERVADRQIAAQLDGRGPSRRYGAGEPADNDAFDVAGRRERIAEQYGSASPVLYGEPPIAGSLGHFEAG